MKSHALGDIPRLEERASGLRHLRWAREILATLEAHHEHDPRLLTGDRDLVLAACVELREQVGHLSAAVKAYRDFLERERVRFRGMVRVGRYLSATAEDADERAEADAIEGGFAQAFRAMDARERRPRKQALRSAIQALRAALEAMDETLAKPLGAAFVASLYPDLAAGGTFVADEGDEDDDATARALH
jgi:hypothetical protein